MAKKRKQSSDNDVANPIITFHALGKTFDRLLKESSLSDLKETVRKKLGLGSGSVVQFSQLRDGQLVDLEDEDDFDAFCAVATDQRHATVEVLLTENSVVEGRSVDAKGDTSLLPPTQASTLSGYTPDPGKSVPRKTALLIHKETPEQRQKRLEDERRQEEEKEQLTREEEEKERLMKEDEARELHRKEKEQKKKERLRREKEEKRRREQEDLPVTISSPATRSSPLPSTSHHPPPSTKSSYTPYLASKLSSQLPSKSAWSKGPPQTTSAISGSHSPATSAQLKSHSRRSSTLGQGVSVKDGVSVPRNNVGAVKQGTAVAFGSIDDVSKPLSTSSATAPPVKSEGVKPFGTLPNTHINGKASAASRPATGPSAPSSSTSTSSASTSTPSIPAVPVSAAPPPTISKFDVRKLFQIPPSKPSNSSTSTETSSPATPEPDASPSQVPPAMPSPPPFPPITAQVQHLVPWPGYYYSGADHQHQHHMQSYPSWNWRPPRMPPAMPRPHQHPLSGPHTSGVPMSPRIHAPPLQSPGTPTHSHAAPAPISHPTPILHAPSSSMSSMLSPPPTPASAFSGYEHLNANSSTSDPGATAPRKKVVLRNRDGIEIHLEKTLRIKISQTPLPSVAPPSRLAMMRPLEDLSAVTYPEGITRPKPELNIGAKGGKFRYDRDFLLQFMSVCKEKPVFLFPLAAFGLEPLPPLSLTPNPDARSVFMSGPSIPFHNPLLQRTEGQGVGPVSSHGTHSKRTKRSSEAVAVGSQAPNLEPVVPLLVTENIWDRKSFSNNDPDSPEVVDTNVKDLLTKLPMEDFDSISDQIIQWANRSENQKDGRTLIQVIRLIFEKATDEITWSGMYARLCRKMMEQISPKVQDEGIRNSEGNPITGGQLFRKYLLKKCQEDYERGWVAKKAVEDRAAKAADERGESGEIIVDSDEYYYAAQKSRRQGLGLIKFLGELFKRQMLTERIIHECIKRLLGTVLKNPEEEEIESLCMLLTTVGSLLDTRRARAHTDVYFQRMEVIGKRVSPRIQSKIQDLIKLRKRNWQPRKAVVASTTIPQVRQAAMEEEADKKKEAMQRLSLSCSGSQLGGTRDDYPQIDGRGSISTARAGDLSQFGRISKPQPPTTFGPSSVFAGKKDDLKHEPT